MWHSSGKSPREPQHRHCLRGKFSVCFVSHIHLYVMGLRGTREPHAVTSSVNKEHFQQQTGLWAGQGRGMDCPRQINVWWLLSHVSDLVLASKALLLQERIDHPVTALKTLSYGFPDTPGRVSEYSPSPLPSMHSHWPGMGQGWTRLMASAHPPDHSPRATGR